METMFSFTDDIFKKFKKEGNLWTATIDCVVVLGVRGVRVRAIKEALKERINRKRRGIRQQVSDLTIVIANKYARSFLGRREFGPQNKQELEKFGLAAQKILTLSNRTELGKMELIKELMYCLTKEYSDRGEVVKIGQLCSDYTWNVLFPQHLKQAFPGYSEIEHE